MKDLSIAYAHLLVASGYKRNEPAPIDPIFQELLDYINSPAYQKLIIDEYKEKHAAKTRTPHR